MPNIYVNRLSVVGDPFILSDLIDQGIGCYPHSPIAGYQTQEEYDKGLYPRLFATVKNWVEKDWPFKKVAYVNKEVPKE